MATWLVVREKSTSSREVWKRSSTLGYLRRNERMRGSSQICRNDDSVVICSGPARPMMLDLLQGGLELLEPGSHGGQQFQALVGDFHPPAVAPKQRHLDVPFQRLDLLADGGGRDVERIGGGREAQVSGHGLEYAQGSQRQSVVGGWHFKFP